MTKARTSEPYNCPCGVHISDKSKSLKKHLTTKIHLEFAQCPPHHWTIDSANGPLSAGFCIKCNAKNKFENSINMGWTGRSQREYEEEEQQKEVTGELEQLVAKD